MHKFVSIKSKDKYAKIVPSTEFTLYFDGCSKGNPGPAGIGCSLLKSNEEIWATSKYIGLDKTNNEAEYSALICGLENALEHNIKVLTVYGDSLLVINQVLGKYKVKASRMLFLFEDVIELKNQFENIHFVHIPRELNERADYLANCSLRT